MNKAWTNVCGISMVLGGVIAPLSPLLSIVNINPIPFIVLGFVMFLSSGIALSVKS